MIDDWLNLLEDTEVGNTRKAFRMVNDTIKSIESIAPFPIIIVAASFVTLAKKIKMDEKSLINLVVSMYSDERIKFGKD